MKRTFITICTLIMLLTLSALPFRSAMAEADEDGLVNLYDVLLVMQYCAGWNVAPNLLNADVSRDGAVDLSDAVMILQY